MKFPSGDNYRAIKVDVEFYNDWMATGGISGYKIWLIWLHNMYIEWLVVNRG